MNITYSLSVYLQVSSGLARFDIPQFGHSLWGCCDENATVLVIVDAPNSLFVTCHCHHTLGLGYVPKLKCFVVGTSHKLSVLFGIDSDRINRIGVLYRNLLIRILYLSM